MIRRPPISTRTDTLFPYTTLFRSDIALIALAGYLLLSIHAFLSARVIGELKLPYLAAGPTELRVRSEEHTSELQSLMRISYAVFCLKKQKNKTQVNNVT